MTARGGEVEPFVRGHEVDIGIDPGGADKAGLVEFIGTRISTQKGTWRQRHI